MRPLADAVTLPAVAGWQLNFTTSSSMRRRPAHGGIGQLLGSPSPSPGGSAGIIAIFFHCCLAIRRQAGLLKTLIFFETKQPTWQLTPSPGPEVTCPRTSTRASNSPVAWALGGAGTNPRRPQGPVPSALRLSPWRERSEPESRTSARKQAPGLAFDSGATRTQPPP